VLLSAGTGVLACQLALGIRVPYSTVILYCLNSYCLLQWEKYKLLPCLDSLAMVLDNADVVLKSHKVTNARVLFKDGGWIGVNDGDGWTYYPPNKVEHVESKPETEQ